MQFSNSVKTRFFVSIASNSARSAIGFFSGLLIARGLNPVGYGDMMFLLASFTAIRSLLDMGSSTAFYTFISQRQQSRRFYLYYFGWLLLQFLITVLAVAAIMPAAMIEKVWLGHSREIVLLAFVASFMQQQVWQTLNQIGEASRKTVVVQIINLMLSIVHLAVISLLLIFTSLSVAIIFWVFICEYFLATIFGSLSIRKHHSASTEITSTTFKQVLVEYWDYCKPLAALSWLGFLYEFIDRWMLQRFGGADQQGFYQVAYQFSAISLIATSSIINVFWKEIAEANERHDTATVSALYHKISKGLTMLGAIISGLLIPWTDRIVALFLGNSYALAKPVLMITFLYPIHQSMGQIGSTMLLASGQTHSYMILTVISTLISLPVSYFILAPSSGIFVPGLGLGAIGMALKLVFLTIISANVQAWVIARHRGWRYEWAYQVVGVGAALAFGYLSQLAVIQFFPFREAGLIPFLLLFLATGFLYLCLMTSFIYAVPWLIGMTRAEIKAHLKWVPFFTT